MSEHTLTFGSSKIAYSLDYTARKTLGIQVHPDCSVHVKAPEGTAMDKVTETLRKKAPWILQQQREFLSYQPHTPPRRYVNGETHLYLGRQYRLRIVNGELLTDDDSLDTVKLDGGRLKVYTEDGSYDHVKKLLNAWYRQKAAEWFARLLPLGYARFKGIELPPLSAIPLVLREMPTRWGSCTATGKLILNPELIKAPRPCIEYVIIHELCHLVHHNHTRAFYTLQEKVLPNWRKLKDRLERSLV